MDDNFSFCQTELRKLDPIRHFCCLTAPESHRPALIAFFAFIAELERIPHMVSEPSMGQIRLQWWQDIVTNASNRSETGCGAANIGPVASALKQVQKQYKLSENRLQKIIEAHTFDLYNDPMPDLETYETYAGETKSLPLLLACQILNDGEEPEDLADLCGHTGMAISLATHLRDWPRAAKSERLFLPKDAFTRHSITLPALFGTPGNDLVQPAIKALCLLAQSHHFKAMAHFRALKADGKQHLASPFLPLATVSSIIKSRQKKPGDQLRQAQWRAYLSIMRLAFLS